MNAAQFCSIDDKVLSHRVAGQHQDMRPRVKDIPSPVNRSSRTFLDGHPMTRTVHRHQGRNCIPSYGENGESSSLEVQAELACDTTWLSHGMLSPIRITWPLFVDAQRSIIGQGCDEN